MSLMKMSTCPFWNITEEESYDTTPFIEETDLQNKCLQLHEVILSVTLLGEVTKM